MMSGTVRWEPGRPTNSITQLSFGFLIQLRVSASDRTFFATVSFRRPSLRKHEARRSVHVALLPSSPPCDIR